MSEYENNKAMDDQSNEVEVWRSKLELIEIQKSALQKKNEELEQQLDAEREARMWRERQQCATEAELEKYVESNEELREKLADLTLEVETSRHALSQINESRVEVERKEECSQIESALGKEK